MTDFTGIKTFEDLARTTGAMVLCNGIAGMELELINGEYDPDEEIFQWYIIDDPTFLLRHTDQLVFYSDELNVHVWGITHWGTPWSSVPAPELH